MFADVDWARTKAYAMGLNALYINLAGREKNGIVHAAPERDAVIADLKRRLETMRDPETGARMIVDVTALNAGSSRFAPDLIVGYAPGYRASWETALGAAPPGHRPPEHRSLESAIIASRPPPFPECCSGTRIPRVPNPRLKDLTATILEEFGVKPDPQMTGRSVY